MSAIDDKHAQLGGPGGLLGPPAGPELPTPDGIGRFRHFQNGSIYWTAATGAHEVHGAIRAKWTQLGWELSLLGYPLTDETPTPDTVGRFNHFQHGSIYWTPATGAHEIHGAIRDLWSQLGFELSALGYPVSDEQPTPHGFARFSAFQHGSIYWDPGRGAYEVFHPPPRPPAHPPSRGRWELPTRNSGVVGVHAALLHTNQILFFTYKEPPDPHAPEAPQDHGDSAVLDLETMTTARPATLTAGGAAAPQLANLFCAGQAFLPDGRLLVAGGEREKPSVRGLHVFTPGGAGPGSWRPVGQLPAGRWYPTCATLRDGRVIIVAGDNWTPGSRTANKTFAVYDPASGLQSPRPAPFVGEGGYATYPFVALLPNGKLLVHLGTRTRFLDTATLTFDPLVVEAAARPGRNGRTYHLQGTCVLLPLSPVSAPAYRARVMVFGGGGATPTGLRTPATATCEILDTGATTPQWQPTPPMTRPRVMPDAVLLPDGTVFVVNGSSTGVADNGANPVYEAELYDPATNTWRVLDQMRVPRLYHATALLLPDGRVMTAGTDSMWNPDPFHESQLRVELFSPPYLFRGARPTIGGAPAEVGYGATFAIKTSDPEQVAAVALLRAGSCTHSFNSDQRHVALAIVARGPDTLTVQAPPNGNVAPPGYYLLFVLNGEGVPSEGRFVRLR